MAISELLVMPAPKAPGRGWQDVILDSARPFMNGRVLFYWSGDTTDYDPVTNTGGGSPIGPIWAGKARIQHLRAPQEFATDYQADATRYFRFQIDPSEPGNPIPPILPEGIKARVLDGGRDPSLLSLAFVTTSAINSSDRAVRTIELSANMSPVAWTWSYVNGMIV